MITKSNIRTLLDILGFSQEGTVYTKRYEVAGATLKVDVASEHIFYKESGITVGRETTSNFSEPENFVVLECVDRLLSKGYRAEHIELEPQWKLGHSSKSGYADIWIRTFGDGRMIGTDEDKDSLLIIECKKTDEFQGAWNDTLEDGAQLFSYFQQEKSTRFLCLYTSDIIEDKVVPDYYLLNVQDNKKMLENEEGVLSYDKASNNKQLYRVWHETYHCDYARIGLFEESVQPYHIGKDKYTVADLKAVSNETIKKKYSEFSNILRQHNVGAHENAFDKLVNLFLAKVVDETNNPDNLHFYWKGSAYDDDFQLQDRLQRLYRDGMKKFLGEDVTYIEDAEIDKAFRRFKNDPDATRKTIKDYFRALKFFSDNDFSFISVHNKKLFQQNAIILRKVILMLQDIRLKDSDTHQFLGDLFEGFLTKGVKQSEGQFFTPMPIVRFIVTSLPLEQLIKDSQDVPYAIDYACGAGHFLTEYADRIKEFVKQYRPDLSLHDYYSRIMGIEKEYRLSKVSKVSAFMYGHDETQIVYSDALKSHPNVEEGKYSVLIANPPYSVSGFLETLSEQDRKKYKLFNSNINLAKNNAIETFFIERAAQLMKAGGVAGIILPVSVLSKGGIYAKAREIVLENFHIVSLVELGSGTFGKTGTNTVVMFLRRKETNTPDADHYASRVECWFNLSENGNEVYQDTELMEKYCEHLGYAVEDYQEFLKGNMTETFINSEVVQAYHNSFFGSSRNAMKDVCEEAKNIRTRYVAKTKTATFRALSAEENKKEADKAFYAFVKAIEREKMYFFMLAVQTETPVLLVKSPLPKKNESNEKIKKFLGYEWINRKGHEGIHYLNVGAAPSDEDCDDENETEDDTMQEISGINAINTCLFNPVDYNDINKINYLIRQNFQGRELNIPSSLDTFVNTSMLTDLVDFRITSFNKCLRTTGNVNVEYNSKYPSIKLNDMCLEITAGGDKPVVFSKEQTPKCKVPVFSNGVTNNGLFGYTDTPMIIQPCVTISARGTLGYCVFHDGPFVPIVRLIVCVPTSKYMPQYIKYIMEGIDVVNEGATTPQLSVPKVRQYKLPNAPIDVQKKIVSECSKAEEQYQKCIDNISRLKDGMNAILEESHSKATTDLRLDNEQVFNLSIGRRVLKSELKKDGAYEVFSANVFEPFGRIGSSLLTDFSKPSVLWGIDGDWMVNYLQTDRPFYPTDHCGVIKVLDENVILPKYLVYPLLKAGEHERFSRANRASTERIKALTIRIPSIDIQKNTVTKVIEIENEINTLKQKMKECKYQKQVILDKYLK
jgi:type I restriction enzyme M protein